MPTDITVTELQETVTVTGGTTSITVTGDTATVAVATTTQAVSVVDETNSFVINTVTNKSDIGLGNVDNTSDLDKPISNPTKLYVDTEIDNLTTADIEENGNLYYTQARADARVAAGIAAIDYPVDSVNGKTNTVVLTTSDIAEGTNQYFTTARARSSVSGTGSIAYNSTTGVISYTGGSNPTTTDELPEGTTNLYYTSTRANSDFDTRLATKTTSNLNEGTNLYYTASRANSDFDTRLATKSTTNLAEGTNLYYTTARSNTDFDVRLGTKSTTDLAEGTNLYYTDGRARTALSGGTGIAYDNITGVVTVDSTIATKTYADNAATSAANSAVAALVDSAPATLDTLNELAAALGDDANFATTVTTALGQKLNTADFETAFDGHLAEKTTDDLAQGITNKYYASSLFNSDFATKTTSDLTEGTNLYYTTARARSAYTGTGNITVNATTGVISFEGPTGPDTTDELTEGSTNLYYTDARARAAVSGGTGVAYASSTGVIAIGQSVGTSDSPTFAGVSAGNISVGVATDNTIASTNTNGDIVLDPNGSGYLIVNSISKMQGEVQATTDLNYVWPASSLVTISDNNGYSAASSITGEAGNSAAAAYYHYYGDTFSGTNAAPVLNFRSASGNSVAGVTVPFTGETSVAPSAVTTSGVTGVITFNGYTTTGFGNDIATQHQGGGVNSLHSIQFQAFPAENFSDSDLTLTSANITAVASSFRAGLTAPTVTGTRGQISFGSTTPATGQAIRVTGTLTGTATGIVSGNTYYVVVTNGSTTATLSATPGGLPITTTAGTLTGLTLTRCSFTLTLSGQTKVPFGRGAKVAVTGITNIADGTYPVWGTPTTTSVSIGAPHTVAPTLSGTQTLSCRTAYMAGGYRVRGFPTATPANMQNRIELISHTAATATHKADQYYLQGGTNTFNYLGLNAAGGTFACGPITFKNLGATANIAGSSLVYRRTYGCFHKMANVTAAAADTVYAFDWTANTTAHANTQGITVSNTSRIVFDAAGDYNAVIEMVGKNTDSQDRVAYVWLARNGTDLAETAIKLVLTKETTTMLAKDWLVNGIAANDYIEVRFAVDTTTSGLSLEYTPAQSTPYVRPAVASATITITPVGA